jgi:hypothetical protein
MATEAQLLANKRNALRSTGPRTSAGRASSRMNALKFGIHAHSEIIPGEDPAELEQLTADYHQSIRPQGPEEAALVNQAVRADWQLRRLSRAEADVWTTSMNQDKEKNLKAGLPEDDSLYMRAIEDNKNTFDRIYRYQASTARNLRASLESLVRLRKSALLQPSEQNEPNLPEDHHPTPEAIEVGRALPPANPEPQTTAETNPIPESQPDTIEAQDPNRFLIPNS